MKILVTGAAGFIGAEVARRLLERGDTVHGLDNLNDYYDISLKHARLASLESSSQFSFTELDISNWEAIKQVFDRFQPDRVIHLAAQAGVRYSLVNPLAYTSSNLVGMSNVLECCRQLEVAHLVFASSSSVYGANTKMPYSVTDNVDHPVSFYAATKKSNELMAHSYSHLFGLPVTGLRFFTVYGPWGRPDMAYFSFTQKILAGQPIDVYNYGKSRRDFTYIDDIVTGVVATLDQLPAPNPNWSGDDPDPSSSRAPYRIFNIGNNQPVELMEFIRTLESLLGREAEKNFLPLQDGDVPETYADIRSLQDAVGFQPTTNIADGLARFVSWYMDYYRV